MGAAGLELEIKLKTSIYLNTGSSLPIRHERILFNEALDFFT